MPDLTSSQGKRLMIWLLLCVGTSVVLGFFLAIVR
jgi:hypothetical protein